MLIAACDHPQGASWHCRVTVTNLLALGVWTEKRPGSGEDAEPLFVHHRDAASGMIAVFDGVGGAGGARTGRLVRGVERTGAWISSRVARSAAEEWFRHGTEHCLGHPPEALCAHLSHRLREVHRPARGRIHGSMRRALPTTIAALTYQVTGDHVIWQALWAGDSRSYLLDPVAGLQQLSRDDTELDCPLEILTQDPPMTNMVSADRAFRINSAPGVAPLPCLLLCATDGFFGYVHTPAEFEAVLLETMAAAQDEAGWCEQLANAVGVYSGDDASLAVIAIGFENFASLRDGFADRARFVDEAHAAPMRRAVAAGGTTGITAARLASWVRYRSGYEERMPESQEDRG